MFTNGIGFPELLIILLLALLFFGNRLPGVARSLGKSVGEFKKGKEESEKEDKDKDKANAEKKTPDNKSTPS